MQQGGAQMPPRDLPGVGDDLRIHRTLLQDHGYIFHAETTLFEPDLTILRFGHTIGTHNDLTVLESESIDMAHQVRRTQLIIVWEIDQLQQLIDCDEATYLCSHCPSSLFSLRVKIVCDPNDNQDLLPIHTTLNQTQTGLKQDIQATFVNSTNLSTDMSSTPTYSTQVRREPASVERLAELANRQDYLKGALIMIQAELAIIITRFSPSFDIDTSITNPFLEEERISLDEEVAGMTQIVHELALARKQLLERYFTTIQQNNDISWELIIIEAEITENHRAVSRKAAKAVRRAQREQEETENNSDETKPYGWENYQDDDSSTDSEFPDY
ncbi:hypothetical protein DFP73DRAFT_598277 [Morchella snyderi]|nr:hypothetical protein DFP73DRAFT_598277 [Morchella snyderi]